MPDAFHELVNIALRHLQELKERGVHYVPVSPPGLEALARINIGTIKQGERSGDQQETRKADVAPTALHAGPRGAAPGPSQQPDDVALQESTASPATSPSLASQTKAQALAELTTRAMQCMKCPHLASSRKNVVFGVGDIDAQIMFVGEAPGADEDLQGEPFVGKAGQLLTKIIETMGVRRNQVYIANILKCRPDTPGQSAGNRKPTPAEMQTCIPYLHAQIDLIQPKVLIALGATAVEGLLGRTEGITRLRGNWKTYRNIPLMPTYHPAYLLRNQALSEKRRVWEDMLQVMEKVGMPISEKQRNYFL